MVEQWFREQISAFAATVDGADPDAWVPSCPDWRLRDLVAHVGQAPRWAAGIVRSGKASAPPDVRDIDPGASDKWARWLVDGGAELLDAVAEVDAEVWTPFGPRPPAFWVRRLTHEVCVHRADAALAAGVEYEVDPDLAADTITEGLELLSTPGESNGRTIQVRPTEPSLDGWLITLTPDGFTWERTTADADLTATGRVRDLLLVFSRRLPRDDDRVTITGDRALLDQWLAYTE